MLSGHPSQRPKKELLAAPVCQKSAVKAKILIAEEDHGLSDVLIGLFRSLDHRVRRTSDLAHLRQLLLSDQWQALYCSVSLWRSSQLEEDLLHFVRLLPCPPPVVLMASYAELDLAEQALQAGASGWLAKPIRSSEALQSLEKLLQEFPLDAVAPLSSPALASPAPDVSVTRHFDVLIGEHPCMRRLYDQITKIAITDMTVLLRGESGTGKELFAMAVHHASHRAEQPFVAINCASLPEQLLESELFGHVKGAFTGAVRNKDGLFLTAQGGTLLLDEVGSIPVNMQLALLRVLQERKIRPVGGNDMLPVDVRVIAATNEDLEQRMQQGLFREDLFYRLSVMPMMLPPLRERKSDIALLAQWFLSQMKNAAGQQFALAAETLQALENYSWPGNVRELENVLKRAVALGDDDSMVLQMNSLPEQVMAAVKAKDDEETASQSVVALPPDAAGLLEGGQMTLRAYLRHCERHYIRQVLADCNDDKKACAKLLGVSLGTLYRKLEDFPL